MRDALQRRLYAPLHAAGAEAIHPLNGDDGGHAPNQHEISRQATQRAPIATVCGSRRRESNASARALIRRAPSTSIRGKAVDPGGWVEIIDVDINRNGVGRDVREPVGDVMPAWSRRDARGRVQMLGSFGSFMQTSAVRL